MPHRKQKYIIDLHKWRSITALVACSITLIATIYAIVSGLLEFRPDSRQATSLFQYLTQNANSLTALAAGLIIPYTIEGIRKKRFIYPKWLAVFHYSGAVTISLVLVFSVCFMGAYDPVAAFGGQNFYLHIICPVLVLASFFLVENDRHYTIRDSIFSLIPIAIYACVYTWEVGIVGPENGGWNDLYHVMDFVPFYFSGPALIALSVGLSLGIRRISNLLLEVRRRKLMAEWKEDLLPVEVKVEVYGLGRHAGRREEESDISIPMDILTLLAQCYGMQKGELLKVYARGVLDAVEEKEEKKK